ncbi:hypothetical protein [Streptomyces rugosispiralis]|uniref:Uncharacterized protein n=1 Tax=Streptomyces rugosispiralis TaxID=2967341 RepID=A0ABT1V4P6_9ACTN|nr:hypothetical protein [Streptomyces rugosispiralis]MCQ8192363.1 hypothetical protein [Streptomyces rugosispiralis]
MTTHALQGAGPVRTVRPERVLPVHCDDYDDYAAFSSPLSAFLAESGDPDFPAAVVHRPPGGSASPWRRRGCARHREATVVVGRGQAALVGV